MPRYHHHPEEERRRERERVREKSERERGREGEGERERERERVKEKRERGRERERVRARGRNGKKREEGRYCVDHYIEPMATFTAWVKFILLNIKISAMQNVDSWVGQTFVHRKFLAVW